MIQNIYFKDCEQLIFKYTLACAKKKKFEFCFVRFVALEGWYKDPRKRFSNL